MLWNETFQPRTKDGHYACRPTGYKAAKRKPDKEDHQRFEARRPLELAQMDVLEFFINKLKVYMLLFWTIFPVLSLVGSC